MKIVAVFVFSLALISVACSPSENEGAKHPVEAPPPRTAAGRTLVTGVAPAGAVVALEPLFEHDFAAPSGRAYMDQSGQMFIPELLAAQTGQEVEFRSSEDVLHNVRVDHADTNKPIFNVATPPFGNYVHKFDEPGFYRVSCDIHPAMRATLFLTRAPYLAQVPDTGRFSFRDVVPGSYRVTGFIEGTPIDKTFEVSGSEAKLQVP